MHFDHPSESLRKAAKRRIAEELSRLQEASIGIGGSRVSRGDWLNSALVTWVCTHPALMLSLVPPDRKSVV